MRLGSLCSVPALMSAGVGVGAAKDYKSPWRWGKQTGDKAEVEVAAAPVSISRCMDEQTVVCSYNGIIYYPFLEKREIRTLAETGMTLGIMLSDISPSLKDSYCLIPLIGGT